MTNIEYLIYKNFKKNISKISIILLLSLISSCGGGGGGGGGGSSPTTTNENVNNDNQPDSWSFVSEDEINEFRDLEYNFLVSFYNPITDGEMVFSSYHLENINAAKAYASLKKNDKNIAGNGVKIAIIDSGIESDNDEISSNLDINDSYNHVDDSYNIDDIDGHGTFVASIAAGVKNGKITHGVAYEAEILAIKAGNGVLYENDIADSINYAVDKNAKVINLSLGGDIDSSIIKEALINAKLNDVLSVISSGNDGKSEPFFPANLANDPDLQDSIISVGAVDKNNEIADFSNRCGSTKEFCLVAPGVDIVGSTVNNSATILSGTSMSAPNVAGAVAVIRGAWPHLTAAQTSEIILSTATDLGAIGVDEIYGHGLLNLGEAVQAQGQNLIAFGNKIDQGGYDLNSTEILANSIFGDAFTNNVAPKLQDAVFYDKYGRDYKANLANKININNSNIINLENISFNIVKRNVAPINLAKFGFNSEISFAFDSFVDQEITNKTGLKFATIDNSINHNIDQNSGFAFQHNLSNFNSKLDLDLGFAFNIDKVNNLNPENNVNFGLVGSNYHSGVFQSFLQNSNTENNRTFNQLYARKKLFNDKLNLLLSVQNSYDSDNLKFKNKQNQIFDLGLSYDLNRKDNISLSIGRLDESKNNILNSKATGAFTSDNDNKTSYAKISIAKNISDNINLYASHSLASAEINGNNQGIFRNYRDIKLQSSSISIVHDDFFNGRLGLTYLEPMRVTSGKVDYDISIARDIEGNLYRSQGSASLKPNGKERDIELFFNKNLKQDSLIQFNLLFQKEVGNIKDANNHYMGVIKYNKKF